MERYDDGNSNDTITNRGQNRSTQRPSGIIHLASMAVVEDACARTHAFVIVVIDVVDEAYLLATVRPVVNI